MMSDKVLISCTFGSAVIIDLEERYCYVQGYHQEFCVISWLYILECVLRMIILEVARIMKPDRKFKLSME